MIRLNMIVEGKTEETFVRNVLQVHLADLEVMVRCQRVEFSRKKGRVYKGGLKSYTKPREHLLRWLKQDNQSIARFTTMFDLYALPTDFPGYAAAQKVKDPVERVTELEEAFGSDIGDHRFIPYIQLHEFEALILSEPAKFREYFLDDLDKVAALVASCEDWGPPELIDDGETTAPSKRIIDKLPGYKSVKATAGPMIANGIGLETIRDRCPHFADWLSKLELLPTSSTQ